MSAPNSFDHRERLYTSGEVAAIVGVTTQTVISWTTQGKLPALRTVGGHRRYRESDIEKLLDERITRAAGSRPPGPDPRTVRRLQLVPKFTERFTPGVIDPWRTGLSGSTVTVEHDLVVVREDGDLVSVVNPRGHGAATVAKDYAHRIGADYVREVS